MFNFVLTTPERLADNRPITSVKGAIKGVWCCHKLRINSLFLRLEKKKILHSGTYTCVSAFIIQVCSFYKINATLLAHINLYTVLSPRAH